MPKTKAVLKHLRELGSRTVDGIEDHEPCIVTRGGLKNPRPGDAREIEVELSFSNEEEKRAFFAAYEAEHGKPIQPAAEVYIPDNWDWERTSPFAVLIRGDEAEILQRLIHENKIPCKGECASSRNFPDAYPEVKNQLGR